MDTQDIFDTLDDVPFIPVNEEDTDNVYKQDLRKLNNYFMTNIPYERHIFRSLKQENSETVNQYVAHLKIQAKITILGRHKMNKYVTRLSITAGQTNSEENYWKRALISLCRICWRFPVHWRLLTSNPDEWKIVLTRVKWSTRLGARNLDAETSGLHQRRVLRQSVLDVVAKNI